MSDEMEDFTKKAAKTHVAFIHETWRQSFARDLSTVLIFIALWSLGHWAESAALEWAGVLVAMLVTFGRAINFLKGRVDTRMTPQQAREWLDLTFPDSQR